MKLIRCQNPDCGNFFEPIAGKKSCSKACRQKAYRLRSKKPFPVIVPKREVWCLNCGTQFFTDQPTAKFCKTSCRVSYSQQVKRWAKKEAERV